ncbi:GAP1-N2 domain-containing protein [Corynebacterium occultum]|nr:hypothetical protein [Corynebacterium occultum]
MSPWTHVTYASFRNASGQGGWRTGPSISAAEEHHQLVAEHAPTSLIPVQTFDDFIGSKAIAELPRRFEYQPLKKGALIMQSVPAGKDATGRPGNVFTHAVIDRDLDIPLKAQYPINFFRSPDLLTPFRATEVNAVSLEPGLAEPRPGSKSDLYASWMLVKELYGDRSGALHRLQDVLQAGKEQAVLLLEDPDQAAFWLMALSSTLTPAEARRLLSFSTFERAAALPTQDFRNGLLPVLVLPAQDKHQLVGRRGIQLIDPDDPATHTPELTGSWAQLTTGLLRSGLAGDELPAELMAANESARVTYRLGDGLARLVRKHAAKLPAELVKLADQQLDQGKAAAPRAPVGDYLPHRRGDLAWVEKVIANPLLADPSRMPPNETWQAFQIGKLPPQKQQSLREQAMKNLELIYAAPILTLIYYVDFLLQTQLLVEKINGSEFRSHFNHFPAMDEWQQGRALHPGAHSQLHFQFERANREYGYSHSVQPTTRAPRGQVEQHRVIPEPPFSGVGSGPDREPAGAEKWLAKIGLRVPIGSLIMVLRAKDTPVMLQRLLDEEVIENSPEDYSDELLRVYYSVVLRAEIQRVLHEDAIKETALTNQLTELTRRAVQHRVEPLAEVGGDLAEASLKDLGRTIADQDYQDLPWNDREMAALLRLVESYTRKDYIRRSEKINLVFGLVAQAMLARLKEKTPPVQQTSSPSKNTEPRTAPSGERRRPESPATEPPPATQSRRRFRMKNKNKEKN